MVEDLSQQDRKLSSIICINIWSRRNYFLFEEKFEQPKTLVENALKQLGNFYSTLLPLPSHTSPLISDQLTTTVRWKKPVGQILKANWDVALNFNHKILGLRGLTRDANGEVLLSFTCNEAFSPNATLAECLALRKAMTLCAEAGFEHVIF